MRLNKSKIIFKIGTIVVFIILILLFKKYFAPSHNLKLSFLNVGQGDACIIKTPNNKIVIIDGGPDNLILRRLGEEIPFYKRKIDLIITSHFHEDHITGLIEIFRRYKVKYLVLGENIKQFYPAALLFSEARKQNTKIIYVNTQIKFAFLSDCYLNILNPINMSKNNDNDNDSLISKLSCGDLTFLSSGDNEGSVEEEILKTDFDLSAQIFKASHHGSKTSNTYDFLEAVSPELMVISVGEANRFGHPSKEVLNRADSLNIGVKRTDELGTVNILADID
ncbi:MAG TPA: MBL fold metallo-hydrolase [Patescibacteria group bacterium]|nr:MBL fold metallo-hydrolase [Patescibacteria group bacterium]